MIDGKRPARARAKLEAPGWWAGRSRGPAGSLRVCLARSATSEAHCREKFGLDMATLTPPTWLRIAVLLAGWVFPARIAAAQPTAPTPTEPAPVVTDVPPAASRPAAAPLSIVSDSPCPSGPAVAAALATLCPPTEWPQGTVRIHAAADLLFVELVSDGATQRQLRVTGDCAVRATTVALVIATWTGELASDAAGTPILRRPRVEAPREAPAKVVPASIPPPPAPIAHALEHERELGAGLLLAVTGGIAPGLCVDFVDTRAPSGLGWQAGLTLPAQRERAVPGATTSWTRASASFALNGRITLRGFALSAAAGLAGAYTLTSGHGFSIAQDAQALTGGLVAGARLSRSWRWLRIWTAVQAYKWLLPQTVAVDTKAGDWAATVELPSSDFHWALGLSYLFR